MGATVEFGVVGFDELIPGGIHAGSSYLIQGAPGTGKTTFGLQFIWEGVNRYKQKGVVVTLEEFPGQFYRDAAQDLLAEGVRGRNCPRRSRLRR